MVLHRPVELARLIRTWVSRIPTSHPSAMSSSMRRVIAFCLPHNERIDDLFGRSSKSRPSFVGLETVVLSRAPRPSPPRTRFAQWLHADYPQSIPQLSHRLRRGWKGK